MKKALPFVIVAALAVMAGCSGDSPSAPAAPTPPTDTWTVTSFTAEPSTPIVGETVVLTATIQKNGSVAPDGTGVAFEASVLSGEGGGFFVSTSSTSVTTTTSAGKAVARFYSATASDYSIRVRAQSATTTLTISFSGGEPLALYGVVPSQGSQDGGETVNLAGTGFTANMQVTFDVTGLAAFPADVVSVAADHHSALVRTPALAGADPTQDYLAKIVVAIPGVTETAELPDAFRFVHTTGEPEIYSLYPAQGTARGGDQVTVYGRNFTAPVEVSFNTDLGTVEAQEVALSADGTQISLITPPLSAEPVQGDHVADVTVRSGVGTGNEKTATRPNGFVFLADHPEPNITGVSPTSGPMEGGTHVTIFGTGFEFPVQVMFGDREADVLSVAYDQIVCLSPDYTPSGLTPPVTVDVTVRNINSGLTSTMAGAFTYGESMFITSNAPSEGPPTGGTQVTIFGSGFRAPLTVEWIPGSGAQTDAVPAQVVSVSGNQIVIVTGETDPIPCDDAPGMFRVTQIDSGVSAEGGSFTYAGQDLRIYGVTPPEGGTGDTVTITGRNFAVAETTENVRVTFDDLQPQMATFPNAGDRHTIQTTVPDTSTYEFEVITCTGNQNENGCQEVPSPVDVTVENLDTGCTDTLDKGFSLVPPVTACQEVIVGVSDTSHDFGSVTVGNSATWQFQIQNNGTAGEDLTFEWTATPPDGFTVSPDTGTLAPGASVPVTVTFTPGNAVPYGGAIQIMAVGGACGAQSTAVVNVTGQGQ